jgi:crossover junction endodeoxyribonuclease RusA
VNAPEALSPKNEIRLVLPYPPSGNRYWRHAIVANHVQVYTSKEAKAYKADIAWRARAAGIKPILGPIEYELALYPHRPQDWQKRVKLDPVWWDLTVQRLDLDNCRKVLLDALNGVCWTDDSKIMRDPGEVMIPDGEARVEITVRPYRRAHPQVGLFEAEAAA